MKRGSLLIVFLTYSFLSLYSMHPTYQEMGVQICDKISKNEVFHVLTQVQPQIDRLETDAIEKKGVTHLVNAARILYKGSIRTGEYTIIYYQAKGKLEAVSPTTGEIIEYASDGYCKVTQSTNDCNVV